MDLVLYTIISWLVVTYLVTTIQKKEVVRSIIVYSIYILLSVCSFTAISLNLRLISETKDVTKFLSLMINRNITVPSLVVIFINLFYRLTSYKKIIPIILLLLMLTLSELINLKFQIYSYTKWSFALTFIMNTLFVLVTLVVSKHINAIESRSEHK